MTSRPFAAQPFNAREAFLRCVPVAVGVGFLALTLAVFFLASGAAAVGGAWAGLALGCALIPGVGSALASSERARLRLAVATMICALGGAGVIAASLAL